MTPLTQQQIDEHRTALGALSRADLGDLFCQRAEALLAEHERLTARDEQAEQRAAELTLLLSAAEAKRDAAQAELARVQGAAAAARDPRTWLVDSGANAQAAVSAAFHGTEPIDYASTYERAPADTTLLADLLEILATQVGRAGESEGAVDVLHRLVRERDEYRYRAERAEAALAGRYTEAEARRPHISTGGPCWCCGQPEGSRCKCPPRRADETAEQVGDPDSNDDGHGAPLP